MSVLTGLDVLESRDFSLLRGRKVGILCNQASIGLSCRHILDLLLAKHRSGHFNIRAVFGPEHGLWGHTQDNMIEWEGKPDPRTGLIVHSLYGKHREPTSEMLDGIDLFVVDIPDVGARYYTFIWSMALCMRACQAAGIPMMVLDRPNPIGGLQTEGTVLRQEFGSFVGLYPLPTRHAMTVGEISHYLHRDYFQNLNLKIIQMTGWKRTMYFGDSDLPWAMPSPNMPTADTALVYPGMCLFEGTTLSEGRGTTRPFEIFGAPGIDGWRLADALNERGLPGTYFRPIQFEPTFNKHAGTLCEGCFIHVDDRLTFDSVMVAVLALQEIARLFPAVFGWKPAPYEYVHDKRPIDILAGNDWLRVSIERQDRLSEIQDRMKTERNLFEPIRSASVLYS